MKTSTKKLVLTAMFTALITISTMFIRIPLPTGYVNLGDAFILLSVFILGPIFGTVASGLGSAIADTFGYITYAPGTLIIKSLMALGAYCVYKIILKLIKNHFFAELLAGIIATIIMSVGYLIYETLFFVSISVAIVSLPYNLLQGITGTTIAILIMKIFVATKLLEKLKD